MRIVSLVPHATELLFALGLGEQVVGVTHECDYPPRAQLLERVTRDALPAGLTAAQIDTAVRERTRRGEAIYELDEGTLAALEPDLIVTQALCPVCAVSYGEVVELARELPRCPRVIALDPHTLGETLEDVTTLAQLTGSEPRGAQLLAEARTRIARVESAARAAQQPAGGAAQPSLRPRVAALEWFDPVYVAGHWTPELIELAGAEDVLGAAGAPSRVVSWEELTAAEPEIVIAMPCGWDAARARAEADAHSEQLAAAGARRVVAVNGGAYFSRPGPRLIEGLELLAHIFHRDLFAEAPGEIVEVPLATLASARRSA
ncbi:MAG: cobalamin-binding protein [Actinobacteria bacterium]|nr:MAG: cobalamin-binding protein [Actinomycetota bacterium]